MVTLRRDLDRVVMYSPALSAIGSGWAVELCLRERRGRGWCKLTTIKGEIQSRTLTGMGASALPEGPAAARQPRAAPNKGPVLTKPTWHGDVSTPISVLDSFRA